ncbi:MAG: 2-oxoacid:acceptor oxidoreductase family protein, partial [Candidatus Villigracilaceae bacterium]
PHSRARGAQIHSPIVGLGEADVLLAFEKLEALRNLRALRPGGLALINNQAIVPLTVTSGGQTYPADAEIRAAFAAQTGRVYFVEGECLARNWATCALPTSSCWAPAPEAARRGHTPGFA